MITLTLLHPLQEVPVQSWTFKNESTIRVGRASDNEVVLYSAVVSRYHLEFKKTEQSWEAINLGANGTYVNGKSITIVSLVDGMTLRLANSGPKILVKIDSEFLRQNAEDSFARKAFKEQILKRSRDTLIN
ncbi:FHA domain-containing protein [Myxosarcina sp. GI1]|uniref:FHA domain-containing protein n=1 Tax=Myxosarcina sp. GI1 TaxID=1541065 RepID=UPI00055E0A9D|nr:FHA domain-containing protein [Myxosarcina sp. GI1]